MTQAQKEMVEWIRAQNEEKRQWVAEDPKNRFAPALTDDVEHWEGYGIKSLPALLDYLDECAREG